MARHRDVCCPVVLALLAIACTRAQEQAPAAEPEPGTSAAEAEEAAAPSVAEAGPETVPHRFSMVRAFVRRDPVEGEVGAWTTLDDQALPGTEVEVACGPEGDEPCSLAVEYLGTGPDADRYRLTVVAPGDALTREGVVEYRGEELVLYSGSGWQAGLGPAEDEAR
jgi:hypothetical protein